METTDCFWCGASLNGDGLCESCGSTLQQQLKKTATSE